MVVCGYREPDLIADSNLHHFDHRVFQTTRAQVLANKALALFCHLDRLWFHLDVDVLDPTIMPVLFPEPNGLGIDETLEFLSTSIRSRNITGMSIACYFASYLTIRRLKRLRFRNNSIPYPCPLRHIICPLHLRFLSFKWGNAIVMTSPTDKPAFVSINIP